jgi:predicted MFS family arabinose efflux permease
LSISGAIAPIITGRLITEAGTASFHLVYLASALLLIPFLAIISFYFSDFKDPSYPRHSIKTHISTFVKERDIRNVFISHLFLQFFFTWMTIYTPLYLATHAGFSWLEISYIVFAGLLAYVICEYPIGLIADKYLGEKEMMAFGFFLIAVSTSWLAFLPAGSLPLWMAVMFLTRVGASFVEVTTESYFFKHTKSNDSDKISLFRGARPLGSVVGAVLGSLILLQIEFSFMFILLGIFMLPGIFFTLLLRDTR